ncbi:MAG: electron transport complex subunit RsxE [Desulfosarcina sp.]|nr:electron transport complex subunit RsxE [Desulfosarcina sp.]
MADQPTAAERFIQGILPENPVYRQLLGLCPTLAVTNSLMAAVTMAGAVGFVLLCANVIISLIRNLLKPHLRIVVFTLTIATFVTIADRLIAAYLYQMSKTLGPYIPLIIVNCIIICRCEVCASKHGLRVMPAVWPDWVIMVLPPGAFLTFGLLLGTVNWIVARRGGKKIA